MSVKTIKNKHIYFFIAISISIILLFPIGMDKFIIGNSLGFTSNISSEGWASFLGSYLGSIISSIIGFIGIIITILFTRSEANKDRESAELQRNEGNRLSLIPYIKIEYDGKLRIRNDDLSIDNPNESTGNGISFPPIYIKNVGLNTMLDFSITNSDPDNNNSQELNSTLGFSLVNGILLDDENVGMHVNYYTQKGESSIDTMEVGKKVLTYITVQYKGSKQKNDLREAITNGAITNDDFGTKKTFLKIHKINAYIIYSDLLFNQYKSSLEFKLQTEFKVDKYENLWKKKSKILECNIGKPIVKNIR